MLGRGVSDWSRLPCLVLIMQCFLLGTAHKASGRVTGQSIGHFVMSSPQLTAWCVQLSPTPLDEAYNSIALVSLLPFPPSGVLRDKYLRVLPTPRESHDHNSCEL